MLLCIVTPWILVIVAHLKAFFSSKKAEVHLCVLDILVNFHGFVDTAYAETLKPQ